MIHLVKRHPKKKETRKMNTLLRLRFWGSSELMARISTALVVLGLVFLLIAGFAGCVSKASNEVLKTENTALKARIPTLVYNSYQSNELGMEFAYPATWVRQDTKQIVPFFVSADGVANVGVTREILPQAMTTDAYFAALNKQLQAQGYILCGTRKTQAGSASGIQAVYLNKGLLQVFFVVAKGQTAWSLMETAKAEQFIDWAHTFNEVANSFKVQ
jgi:hypothetical protein